MQVRIRLYLSWHNFSGCYLASGRHSSGAKRKRQEFFSVLFHSFWFDYLHRVCVYGDISFFTGQMLFDYNTTSCVAASFFFRAAYAANTMPTKPTVSANYILNQDQWAPLIIYFSCMHWILIDSCATNHGMNFILDIRADRGMLQPNLEPCKTKLNL